MVRAKGFLNGFTMEDVYKLLDEVIENKPIPDTPVNDHEQPPSLENMPIGKNQITEKMQKKANIFAEKHGTLAPEAPGNPEDTYSDASDYYDTYNDDYDSYDNYDAVFYKRVGNYVQTLNH